MHLKVICDVMTDDVLFYVHTPNPEKKIKIKKIYIFEQSYLEIKIEFFFY